MLSSLERLSLRVIVQGIFELTFKYLGFIYQGKSSSKTEVIKTEADVHNMERKHSSEWQAIYCIHLICLVLKGIKEYMKDIFIADAGVPEFVLGLK